MKRTSPLVPVEWLVPRLDGPDVVILDASVYLDPAPSGAARGEFRSGVDQFRGAGHIPGARFADLFTEFSDPTSPFPFMRPDPDQFESAAGRLGIEPGSHVVVYDGLAGQWAARLWWVFRTLGHSNVSVLDGGLKRYKALGGELEMDLVVYEKTTYRIANAQKPRAEKAEVVAISSGQIDGQLICLLQPDDFSGKISVRARAGHIPASVNLPFTKLIDTHENTMLPRERLEDVFRSVTPLRGERIVTYCGGGVASTYGALALDVIGYENTVEYDGSLNEWLADPNLQMETGLGSVDITNSK
ncbi:sulfurtransferase [Neorhizobium lilium]|uniref:Sulfurtransferase n=1 Tax=Neorhizobium lilium TaxID=2503024 RepID=A0A444LMV9_9HYPH|nr:sulfurtransferase [Neorhizobium lilium]RWX81644.1 sulfurtransferase [Neorhizobium lilium]